MLTFIALFIPSVAGLKVIDYFEKELDLKESIYYYLLLLIFSIIFTNILVYLLFGVADRVCFYLNSLPIFFSKYALLSLVINLLFGFVIVVIRKNISFKIEVEKIEKDERCFFNDVKKRFRKTKKHI